MEYNYRKLLFRIWDHQNKKFFKPTYEAYNGKLEALTISTHGELIMHTMQERLIHESIFPNRFEITQYTGLDDKYGKQIFEGDIIKSEIYETIGDRYVVESITEFHYYMHDLLLHMDDVEVIGNIYESTESAQAKPEAE